MRNTQKFGQISRSRRRPRPTPKSGRASQINCNTSHQIPVWVIKAVNACAASMPAPARFSNLQCPPFAPESEHPAYAPQGRKLNFKTARGLSVPSTDFFDTVPAPTASRVSGGLLVDLWIDDFKCMALQSFQLRFCLDQLRFSQHL